MNVWKVLKGSWIRPPQPTVRLRGLHGFNNPDEARFMLRCQEPPLELLSESHLLPRVLSELPQLERGRVSLISVIY